MVASRLILKTTPPRLARVLHARNRLETRWLDVHDRAAIIVTAPQGFGKTTLLTQWRRRWLEHGRLVAWLSLDAQDERSRFVDLLGFALKGASGRESFAVAARQGQLQAGREIDALTTMLAELATLATPTVVVIDDAHRAPQVALGDLLSYLLCNAPPNVQFAVGTRRPLNLRATDLVATGQLALIGSEDLRLTAEESREFLTARFGSSVGLDDAARLHDRTEGWPLGLQLVATALESATDRHAAIGRLGARQGDIQRFFFESMQSSLAPDEAAFAVRVSILETLNAELCEAVTGYRDSARLLAKAVQESPVVTEAEDRGWVRLHAMARDFLLGQFDRLPVEERRACYERASAWYAANDQFQEAARHAWAAGNESQAVGHAEHCLRDIAREGRLGEARDWLGRIPASSMARNVGLQLTAAWIRALGDSPDSVPELVERILQRPDLDTESRFEAANVAAAAALFTDRPGRLVEALRDWQSTPPGATPLNAISFANSRAIGALQSGDTAGARRILEPVVSGADREPSMRLALSFSDLAMALSWLWEGNPAATELVLRPRLAAAEREIGRRSVIAGMLAGTLAGALYLRGEFDAACALIADRLDVIERAGMPDPIVIAYRVLAETALWRGETARSLQVFESLGAVGAARGLPRLVVAALLGQVAVHVRAGHVQSADTALAAAKALRASLQEAAYGPMLPHLDRRIAVATAAVRLSRADPEGAEAALAPVLRIRELGRGPDGLIARALAGLAAQQLRQPGAQRLIDEALDLADLHGMRWLVERAHPALAHAGDSSRPRVTPATAPEPSGVARKDLSDASPPTSAPPTSGLLTPREARILSLLASGMANKEIARAMDIGEQTVKWHLKNLFFKLNAASRRHAVDRARLLGLLSC
jgi:LuxR family maltose regulon positive regulatory protein